MNLTLAPSLLGLSLRKNRPIAGHRISPLYLPLNGLLNTRTFYNDGSRMLLVSGKHTCYHTTSHLIKFSITLQREVFQNCNLNLITFRISSPSTRSLYMNNTPRQHGWRELERTLLEWMRAQLKTDILVEDDCFPPVSINRKRLTDSYELIDVIFLIFVILQMNLA
jgi:hypothetical protein